jgi:hypothetical protein
MALVAIHPELDRGPLAGGSREESLDEISMEDMRMSDEESSRRVNLILISGVSADAIDKMTLAELEQAYRSARQGVSAEMLQTWREATAGLRRKAEEKFQKQRGRFQGNREPKEQWTFANAQQVKDPGCPKLLKVRDHILQKPDCGHLVFCDNVAVHAWLVMLLVAAGFPKRAHRNL